MSGVVSFLREFQISSDVVSNDTPRTKEAAFQDGLAEGRALERAEADAQVEDALSELRVVLASVADLRREAVEEVRRDAGLAVASVVRAICPHLSERGLFEKVRHVMTETLSDAQRPVTLHVAAGGAAELIERLTASIDHPFEIRERADFFPAQIEIEWAGGGGDIDIDGVSKRILALADELEETIRDGGLQEAEESDLI